jgi:DNA-binding NtrC family response regulator
MESPRTLVVCERSGRWALPLRLAADRAATGIRAQPTTATATPDSASLPGWEFRVVETRSPEECCLALASLRRAIVAVELDRAHCDQALALVHTIRERFPATIIVAVAGPESADYQWLARELGAAQFVASPSHVDDFVILARRHWESWATPELGTAEQIWATLPW